MDDPTWYYGTVKTILHGKGYGFVSCDECYAQYNTDAYLHSSQLEGLEVGMQIVFKVKINARGQPQVIDASLDDGGAAAAPALSSEHSVGEEWLQAVQDGGAQGGVSVVLNGIVDATGDFEGTILAVADWLDANSPSNASAPPKAPRVSAPMRPKTVAPPPRQVAPPARQVTPRQVAPPARSSPYGNSTAGKGGKRASAPANDWGSAASGEERFEGTVSAIKRPTPEGRPGFGFIQSDAAKAMYGDDPWLHSTQAEQLKVGDQISFEVQMNKAGRPQAVNVMCMG